MGICPPICCPYTDIMFVDIDPPIGDYTCPICPVDGVWVYAAFCYSSASFICFNYSSKSLTRFVWSLVDYILYGMAYSSKLAIHATSFTMSGVNIS